MQKSRVWRGLLLAIVAALVLAVWQRYGENWFPGRNAVIRLNDDQVEILMICNNIAEFIIENGYGHPVERTESTTKELKRLIGSGEVDLFLEFWAQNNEAWFAQELKTGNLVNLGEIYESGQQFWMIPKWMADTYNIRTVFDMKRYWQLFFDPEDPSKGLFLNCIPGWTCLELNKIKMQAYGLDKFYNAVSPSTSKALEMALENAQLKKIPVFGYFWSPNALLATYEWTILKEPQYTPACWDRIMEAVKDPALPTPDGACGYPDIGPIKIAHHNLLRKAPDVAKMIGNMRFSQEALMETVYWSRQRGRSAERTAVYFLQNFESLWKQWVPPDVFARVKKSAAEIRLDYPGRPK